MWKIRGKNIKQSLRIRKSMNYCKILPTLPLVDRQLRARLAGGLFSDSSSYLFRNFIGVLRVVASYVRLQFN